jgi:hypothetical protein
MSRPIVVGFLFDGSPPLRCPGVMSVVLDALAIQQFRGEYPHV